MAIFLCRIHQMMPGRGAYPHRVVCCVNLSYILGCVRREKRTKTMIDILFSGIGWTDIALTLNRIAVGMFFMLSGYHKLFNPQRHRAFADELKGLGVHAIGLNQWWVPTVEFTAGAAVVIGLLAPLAALGLLVVILVAIVTSGPQRIGIMVVSAGADLTALMP